MEEWANNQVVNNIFRQTHMPRFGGVLFFLETIQLGIYLFLIVKRCAMRSTLIHIIHIETEWTGSIHYQDRSHIALQSLGYPPKKVEKKLIIIIIIIIIIITTIIIITIITIITTIITTITITIIIITTTTIIIIITITITIITSITITITIITTTTIIIISISIIIIRSNSNFKRMEKQ